MDIDALYQEDRCKVPFIEFIDDTELKQEYFSANKRFDFNLYFQDHKAKYLEPYQRALQVRFKYDSYNGLQVGEDEFSRAAEEAYKDWQEAGAPVDEKHTRPNIFQTQTYKALKSVEERYHAILDEISTNQNIEFGQSGDPVITPLLKLSKINQKALIEHFLNDDNVGRKIRLGEIMRKPDCNKLPPDKIQLTLERFERALLAFQKTIPEDTVSSNESPNGPVSLKDLPTTNKDEFMEFLKCGKIEAYALWNELSKASKIDDEYKATKVVANLLLKNYHLLFEDEFKVAPFVKTFWEFKPGIDSVENVKRITDRVYGHIKRKLPKIS